MTPLCTRIYTHPFFEATPPGAAPGPPVKNRVPVFATSGGVKKEKAASYLYTQSELRTSPVGPSSLAPHDERARKTGNENKMRRIGLLESFADIIA